jgi:glucose/arabinose dehydrogenase
MTRAQALVVAALAAAAAFVVTASATAAMLPAGFSESVALHGLDQPTVARFSPDGRVFVAEKSGVVEVFASAGASTPTVFADLRNDVYDFWDRGLLGMALDPHFPVVPYAYVLYTYDHVLGEPAPAPRWSPGGSEPDACPDPPGATALGCVASGRLVRLRADGNVTAGKKVLVEDWCQQFQSHSLGALAFGPDGMLYAGGGDAAAFNAPDSGQFGNPCGDPEGEGGALRSQDLRTAGDPSVSTGP